jgi:hypothetical protein
MAIRAFVELVLDLQRVQSLESRGSVSADRGVLLPDPDPERLIRSLHFSQDFLFRNLGTIGSTPQSAAAGAILLILPLPSGFLTRKGTSFASSGRGSTKK